MSVSENFTGLILRTSDSFIRDNVYMLDRTLLAKGLKNIAPEHQDKILRNMSGDAAADVRRIMSDLGDIGIEMIEAAQQEIISLASQVF